MLLAIRALAIFHHVVTMCIERITRSLTSEQVQKSQLRREKTPKTREGVCFVMKILFAIVRLKGLRGEKCVFFEIP
jgi:hypothetical protein